MRLPSGICLIRTKTSESTRVGSPEAFFSTGALLSIAMVEIDYEKSKTLEKYHHSTWL
jgi:hypothetical protein